MAKINLLALPAPERKTVSRTFTDPAQPGVALELSLCPLDLCESAVAADRGAGLFAKYGETGFPLLNGGALQLTPSVCELAAILEAMQRGPEEDRYTAEEFFGLFGSMPNAAKQVAFWVGELSEPAEDAAGNPSAAAESP